MSYSAVQLIVAIAMAVVLIIAAISLSIVLRAFSARLMTGKWPHQSQESQDIFDGLP